MARAARRGGTAATKILVTAAFAVSHTSWQHGVAEAARLTRHEGFSDDECTEIPDGGDSSPKSIPSFSGGQCLTGAEDPEALFVWGEEMGILSASLECGWPWDAKLYPVQYSDAACSAAIEDIDAGATKSYNDLLAAGGMSAYITGEVTVGEEFDNGLETGECYRYGEATVDEAAIQAVPEAGQTIMLGIAAEYSPVLDSYGKVMFDESDACGTGNGGKALLVLLVVMGGFGGYTLYTRRKQVNSLKDDKEKQQEAATSFANMLGAGMGNLTMDRDVISAAHKGLGVIEPEVKSLFETIDHDSSGALSRAEVAQLLADQNIVVESTYLDGVLDAYDLDQSGEIELEEFAALYTVLRRKAIASPDAPPPAAAGIPPPAAAAAQRKPPPPLAALTPPAGKKGPPPSLAGLRPTGA